MIIRQNPMLSCDGDEEARHFCAHLARASINAIAAFVSECPKARSSGYFISTAIVECIYHLVYIVQDRGLDTDRSAALDAFRKAYQLLTDLAPTWITARRALRVISSVICSGGDANALFEAISRPRSEPTERLQDTPRDEDLELGSGQSPVPAPAFAELLLGSVTDCNMDSGAGSFSLPAPTMSQISDQILELDSRRSGLPNYTNDPRFADYIPDNYVDMDMDCAEMFSNL